jgi:ATP-dependent DNA helicase RecG
VNKYTNVSDGHSPMLSDNFILEHYGLNELNFESVKHYREKFAAAKPNHPWNGLETKEFLYKIGAWGKLRNSSKEGVTVAGLLMFSEERIITEVLPQYFLEYREHQGALAANGWTKRFTSQDGTWTGNVYDFYFKVMGHLNEENPSLQSALHEAVTNTLVHADYLGEGGIVIEKEPNGIRFSNPGLLRIGVDAVFSGGMSHLRNPNLFKMFILIGLCRRAGFGLQHIQSIWEGKGWQQPAFYEHRSPDRTIFSLMFFPDEAAASYETDDVDMVIQFETDDMHDEQHENTTNFLNNGLNSLNKEFNFINNDENSVNNNLNSVNNGLMSVNKEFNSVDNGPNSGSKRSNSGNKTTNSVNKPKETVDGHYDAKAAIEDRDIDQQLWNIAELARKKKRLHPTTMEQIILRLCAQRPLMLKELAHLLERTSDGLRNNYLAKLLEEGKIRLKYPDQPNHPKQAYMTTKDFS